MAKQPVFLIPSPEQLQKFQAIDPALPALIIQVRDREHQREFEYAVRALIVAALGMALVVGGFIFLVMQNRAAAAATLLGAGVLGMIGGFTRARLRQQD
jgi:hypothetical protein